MRVGDGTGIASMGAMMGRASKRKRGKDQAGGCDFKEKVVEGEDGDVEQLLRCESVVMVIAPVDIRYVECGRGRRHVRQRLKTSRR